MDRTESYINDRSTDKSSSFHLTPVVIALFSVLLSIVLFYLWKKKSSKRSNVLLTGLCESGKTLLFSQLIYRESRETFTSIKENISEYIIEGGTKSISIVDIPGHERLRNRHFDQYKKFTKGIIYVVDSVTVQKDVRDVADFLYTILADASIKFTSILIACNKQDETLAKGCTIVKALLEKELNLVRNTRQNQLQSVDDSTVKTVFLGRQGKDFEFGDLTQKVDVVECSGKECDLQQLHAWLEQL